ncbi:kinesin family member 4 isoform 2 putati [Plasmopara halstedii]|uniref:Kinesin-like protein n=1 Tax=Plasmopara halstedii TaxID=4781 RepID=A0A0P1ADK6_PLAHL|nr:kinesin family member 4 isoform 2 putati [Plasmopara halstedii]CEG38576.1 kinesin family member 4 isoform 2 putati [Plasmopara halstedii]|eukprot:XP_024574945.1 kinesin family member 4 isoform 2 putati [Plasmopara halstedii]
MALMARDIETLVDKDAVKVAVRVRPLSSNELLQGSEVCVDVLDDSVVLAEKQFDFDAAFPAATQQEIVFEKLVSPMIDQYFAGYNSTVFAYGQTGSGKTYTMGNEFASSVTSSDRGIILRVIENIFQRINLMAISQHTIIKMSYLEILNEEIRDLLSHSSSDALPTSSGLSVRGDGNRGIIVNGLSEHIINSIDNAKLLLRSGTSLRATASTNMNCQSSRSHAICTVTMERRDDTEIRISKFHLVDLAGSERIRRTKSEGARFKEGVNINRGLLALGNVINALCERSRTNLPSVHIPYRDSKLTRLLQDSLGGNSKTLMIACISPADVNYEETSNTLRYASRTRNIENKAVINKELSVENEVAYLKQQLEIVHLQLLQQSQKCGADNVAQIEAMHSGSDIKALQEKNRKLKEELRLANNIKDKWKKIADGLVGEGITAHEDLRTLKASQISHSTIKPRVEAGMQNGRGDRGSQSSRLSRLQQLREFQRQRSIAAKENIAVQRRDGSMAPKKGKHADNLPSPTMADTDGEKATNTMHSLSNSLVQESDIQSIDMNAKLLQQVVASCEAIYVAKEAIRANVADRKALAAEKARLEAFSSAEYANQLAELQKDLCMKTDNIRILQQKLESIDKKVTLPSGLFPAKVDSCHHLIRHLVDMVIECKEECWTLSSCRIAQDSVIKNLMAERQSQSKTVSELETRLMETVKSLEVLQQQKTIKKPRKRKQRESYETIETLFSSSDEEVDNNEADPDYVENERTYNRCNKRRGRSMTAMKESKSADAINEADKMRSSVVVSCYSCHGKCATKACDCKSQGRICSGRCSCNSKTCRNRHSDCTRSNISGASDDLAITSFVPSTPKNPTTSEAN